MAKGKLVRDKIPEIIESKGKKPITYVALKKEFEERLAEKLVEEALEFRESGKSEELADILEVIRAICGAYGFRLTEVEKLREKKLQERGGFSKRYVLEGVSGHN
ncbi:MAG: nucleoside triphosphate pyrophosphohydrolase [Patescibacteria group bacterium]